MRKTSGSDRHFHILILPLLLISAATAVVPGAFAANKKKAPQAYATIIGTVFRNPGFALPGAEVTLMSMPDANSKEKVKKQTYTSNQRGEFVFHVPAAPMHYNLTAKAKGFSSQEKAVEVRGEDRVDVTFSLEQESKK